MEGEAKSGIDLVLERYGLSTREEERQRWRREEQEGRDSGAAGAASAAGTAATAAPGAALTTASASASASAPPAVASISTSLGGASNQQPRDPAAHGGASVPADHSPANASSDDARHAQPPDVQRTERGPGQAQSPVRNGTSQATSQEFGATAGAAGLGANARAGTSSGEAAGAMGGAMDALGSSAITADGGETGDPLDQALRAALDREMEALGDRNTRQRRLDALPASVDWSRVARDALQRVIGAVDTGDDSAAASLDLSGAALGISLVIRTAGYEGIGAGAAGAGSLFSAAHAASADTMLLLSHVLTARSATPASERNACDVALGTVPATRAMHPLVVLRLSACELGQGDGLPMLCAALLRNDTVAEVDLSDNWLGESATKAIAAVLLGNSTLAKLDLARNRLGGWADKSGLRAFCTALGRNRSLAWLGLAECNLLASDAGVLAEGLAANCALQSADLRGNALEDSGKMDLAKALLRSRTSILGALHCDEWALPLEATKCDVAEAARAAAEANPEVVDSTTALLSFADIALLAAALKSHASVRVVSIRRARLRRAESELDGDAGGEAGAPAGDPMGRAAVQLIADALLSSAVCNVDSIEANHWELNATAHELVIGGAGSGAADGAAFEDADVALLAGALRGGNRALHTLTLRAPRAALTATGARALAGALQAQHSTLRSLDLSGNVLGVEGVTALTDAICAATEAARGLEELVLVGVGASPECGTSLGAALVASGSLQRLELKHNALGDRGTVALVEKLREDRTCSIAYLGLEHNGIGSGGGLAIANLVPGLRVACIEGNAISDSVAAVLQAREEGGKSLVAGALAQTQVKLHLLGDSGVGKTKLGRALGRHWNLFVSDASAADEPGLPAERTRGGDISLIEVRGNDGATATEPFLLFDHAGLPAFGPGRDVLIGGDGSDPYCGGTSNTTAVFIVVTSLVLPPPAQLASARRWLKLLRALPRCAGVRVVLVGSRRDQLPRAEGDRRMSDLGSALRAEFGAGGGAGGNLDIADQVFPLDCRRTTRTTMSLKDLLLRMRSEIVSADQFLSFHPSIAANIREMLGECGHYAEDDEDEDEQIAATAADDASGDATATAAVAAAAAAAAAAGAVNGGGAGATGWRAESPVFSWPEWRQRVMSALHSTVPHDVLLGATQFLADCGEIVFLPRRQVADAGDGVDGSGSVVGNDSWVILDPAWLTHRLFGRLLAPGWLGRVVVPFQTPMQLVALTRFSREHDVGAGAATADADAAFLPTRADFELKLHELLLEHRPEKLSNIPALLAKYEGREPALLAMVGQKYGLPVDQLRVQRRPPKVVAILLERLELACPLLDGTGRYCVPSLLRSPSPRRWGDGTAVSTADVAQLTYACGRRFAPRTSLDCLSPSFWPRLLVRCLRSGQHRPSLSGMAARPQAQSQATAAEVNERSNVTLWCDGVHFVAARHDAHARIEISHPAASVDASFGCTLSGAAVDVNAKAGSGTGTGGEATISPALAALMRAGAGLGTTNSSTTAAGAGEGQSGARTDNACVRIDVAVRAASGRGAVALMEEITQEIEDLRLACCPGAALQQLSLVLGAAAVGTAAPDGPLCSCDAVPAAELEAAVTEHRTEIRLAAQSRAGSQGAERCARVAVLRAHKPAFHCHGER